MTSYVTYFTIISVISFVQKISSNYRDQRLTQRPWTPGITITAEVNLLIITEVNLLITAEVCLPMYVPVYLLSQLRSVSTPPTFRSTSTSYVFFRVLHLESGHPCWQESLQRPSGTGSVHRCRSVSARMSPGVWNRSGGEAVNSYTNRTHKNIEKFYRNDPSTRRNFEDRDNIIVISS